jgi:hypothetical protein
VLKTPNKNNLLEKKGILTKKELMDEIVSVHKSMVDARDKKK